jgi:hypothetical protein
MPVRKRQSWDDIMTSLDESRLVDDLHKSPQYGRWRMLNMKQGNAHMKRFPELNYWN